MKKYAVVHYSNNWVFNPSIRRYDTLQEAEKYVRDFRGNHYHKTDSVEIVETISKHTSVAVDQSEDNVVYGFKDET